VAFDAALAASGSRAKTSAGKTSAVRDFLTRAYSADEIRSRAALLRDFNCVLRWWYLQSLIPEAAKECAAEESAREWVRVNNKQITAVPIFARSLLFGALAPATLQHRWRALAGTVEADATALTVVRVLRERSYAACAWGRVKNRNKGANSFALTLKGFRTENQGAYSSRCCYAHYEYYADYTAIFSRDGSQVFWRLCDGSQDVAITSEIGDQ